MQFTLDDKKFLTRILHIKDFHIFKQVFYNHFWQRVDTILGDVSVAELLFNSELLI